MVTREMLEKIGGKYWQSQDGSKQRVYFNNWPEFIGLKCSTYNTGNISNATLDGETISNGAAKRLLGSINKVWFDLGTQQYSVDTGFGDATKKRETAEAVIAGIKSHLAGTDAPVEPEPTVAEQGSIQGKKTMSIRLVHDHYDAKHLAKVMDSMQKLEPPHIKAVDLGEGQYADLEGCHRLRAAHALGLTPILDLVEYSDAAIPGSEDGLTVAQVVDSSYREPILEF